MSGKYTFKILHFAWESLNPGTIESDLFHSYVTTLPTMVAIRANKTGEWCNLFICSLRMVKLVVNLFVVSCQCHQLWHWRINPRKARQAPCKSKQKVQQRLQLSWGFCLFLFKEKFSLKFSTSVLEVNQRALYPILSLTSTMLRVAKQMW